MINYKIAEDLLSDGNNFKDCDKIILKYMVNKNNHVKAKTTSKEWLNLHKPFKLYLENRFKESDNSIKETIYRILYKIEEKPKCPICGKIVPFKNKKDSLYCKYCSKLCAVHSKETIEKAKETSLKNWGTEYPSQSNIIKNIISLSLKKDSYKRKLHQKETWINKYGVVNPMKLNLCKDKSDKTKRKNNSYNKSKEEDNIFNIIKNEYPDIIRNYKSELYPFKCDFYIPSLNLYIEYQGFWTHNNHPFTGSSEDLKLLENLKEKEKFYHKQGIKHTTYTDAINTWIKYDPEKRFYAKKNNLNYIEIWRNKNDKKENILKEISKFK